MQGSQRATLIVATIAFCIVENASLIYGSPDQLIQASGDNTTGVEPSTSTDPSMQGPSQALPPQQSQQPLEPDASGPHLPDTTNITEISHGIINSGDINSDVSNASDSSAINSSNSSDLAERSCSAAEKRDIQDIQDNLRSTNAFCSAILGNGSSNGSQICSQYTNCTAFVVGLSTITYPHCKDGKALATDFKQAIDGCNKLVDSENSRNVSKSSAFRLESESVVVVSAALVVIARFL